MDYVLGIDIGTQGTKAALFSEEGQCIAQAFQNSNLIKESDGTIEENPEEQFDAVCKTIKECIDKSKIDPSRIASLAIDGQMAGIIGIGKDGKNVTPFDSWLDSRCKNYIEKMQLESGEEVLEKSGHFPSINHGPKILWWKHEQPDKFKKIQSFVQPGGYAAMRLCGLSAADAYIDHTYLHFSGFANIKECKWDDDLCEKFNLEKEKLPKIVNPEEKVGSVISGMTSRTGLLEGTPVIAGCGDTAASFLSTGATQAGICVDVAGTASVFATTTHEFLPDKKHKTLGCGRAVTKGLWHPYAYINGGGMNIEWFLKEIANHGNIQTARNTDITLDDLNELIRLLKTEENDPIFIPHMGGRVCPGQPNLRGAWIGLTWQHSLAHLYKAVLEGVALEYALYMNILKEGSKDFSPSEIRIIGGGSQSREWNHIKADVLGIPVVKVKREEGAPLGTALLAGYGAGLFTNLNQTAKKWISLGETISPNLNKTKYLYPERISKYAKIINAI